MKKIFLSACLLASVALQAQNSENPWNIGLHGGRTEYSGDLGSSFLDFGGPFYGHYGLSLSRYVTPCIDLTLTGTSGDIGFQEENTSRSFISHIQQWNVAAHLKLRKEEGKFFNPYLLAGAGRIQWFGYNKTKHVDTHIPVGIGINFRLGKCCNLNLQETYNMLNNDYRDGAVENVSDHDNDALHFHTVGLTFNFGGIKDEDKDGISDKKDKCPNTPTGVAVDDKGCPLDGDGDGIADYLDACPTVKGVQSAKGCPDRDGDGIVDESDKCPDAAGLAQFDGCPDKDGDGIIDSEDACPDVAGVATLKGCPDKDGDGITDAEDNCPDEKGPKNLNGCPDQDGDLIIDKNDKCPTVKGTPTNNGCPEVKEEVKKILLQALTGLQFETGKDVIKPSSFPIMDNIVKIMMDNPEYKLSIAGHTDNKGDAAKNQTLSEKRAAAAMKYLVDKGVDASRLRSAGYGQTQPVDDNNTPNGRARNRRVEFKVEF